MSQTQCALQGVFPCTEYHMKHNVHNLFYSLNSRTVVSASFDCASSFSTLDIPQTYGNLCPPWGQTEGSNSVSPTWLCVFRKS